MRSNVLERRSWRDLIEAGITGSESLHAHISFTLPQLECLPKTAIAKTVSRYPAPSHSLPGGQRPEYFLALPESVSKNVGDYQVKFLSLYRGFSEDEFLFSRNMRAFIACAFVC